MTTESSIWTELGIAPTTDVAAIRKAYAARLKESPPGNDAQAFQRVRGAYEAALRLALQRPPTHGSAAGVPVRPVEARPIADLYAEATRVADADADQNSLRDALRRLEVLLTQPEVPDKEMLDHALDAVLASPGAYQVSHAQVFDQALAALLFRAVPRSDLLAQRVVAQLGWEREEVRVTKPSAVSALLTYVADLKVVAELRTGHGQHAKAFGILTSPLPGGEVRRRFYGLANRPEVRAFFLGSLTERPTLGRWVQRETLEWWSQYLRKPRLTRRLALVFPLVSLYAVLAAVVYVRSSAVAGSARALLIAVSLALGPLVAFGWLFGVSWPRWLIRQRLGSTPTVLARTGWAPASLVLVFLAVVLPVHWSVAAFVALLSVGIIHWAAAAAPKVPDSVAASGARRFMFVSINSFGSVVWAVIAVLSLPLQESAAIAAAITASLIGTWCLLASWQFDIRVRDRQLILLTTMATAIVTLWLLWALSDSHLSLGYAAALITVLALAPRPARWALQRTALVWAVRLNLAGALAVPVATMMIAGPDANDNFGVRLIGAFLAYAAIIVAVISAVAEFKSRRGLLRSSA